MTIRKGMFARVSAGLAIRRNRRRDSRAGFFARRVGVAISLGWLRVARIIDLIALFGR
jgi:hypothetical protein